MNDNEKKNSVLEGGPGKSEPGPGESKKEARTSLLLKIYEKSNKSIALLIALTSMLAGIWGLVLPVKNYYDERSKQLHYNLSREMILLANDLRNDSVPSVQQDAVLLLSYYDLNSMPIMLYQLQNFSNSAESKMVDHVITTISLIYMRNKKQVTDEIIYYFSNIYKQTNSAKKWTPPKYNSLLNYSELINKITFREKDSKRLLKMINEMKADIEKKPDLQKKMIAFTKLLDEFSSYYNPD